MIETCRTNPNCEIKPSNCEYSVRCTTYEDLAVNKEVYICGRDNCKKGLGDKEMEKSKMVEEMQELREKVSKLELEKAILRMNCVSETARELFDKGEFNDIVVCEKGFENEKCVCRLNFDSPLDFAKSIIEHKTVVDGWTIEAEGFTTKIPTHERVTFGYDELIEIAEYLLIYCKHNKEDL